MPITIVDPRGGFVRARAEQSPVVMLETDAGAAEDLPGAIRSAADRFQSGSLSCLRSRALPHGVDGVVTWLAGESILSGARAAIRHDLRTSARCTYVLVHVPCLEETPFLTIQPRWFRSGSRDDYWNLDFRIQSSGCASPLWMEALRENCEPWARLSAGIMAETARAGTGVEPLLSLWEQGKLLPHPLSALVLRNLAVLMLRHGETSKAERFLEAGMKMYPGYGELFYLAALHAIGQQRGAQAFPLLEQARLKDSRAFVGSGGECSYRIDWLMGRLAARVGDDRTAFEYFFSGIKRHPPFLPALESLLNLRVSRRLVEARRWELLHVARMQPQFAQNIFDYLLLHRAFDAARHLLRTTSLPETNRSGFEERLAAALSSPKNPAKPSIDLVGPFFEYTSLARINREIAAATLGRDDLNTSLEPTAPGAVLPRAFCNGSLLQSAICVPLSAPRLTIRHQWPPDFRRPAAGKLAAIVPWEYGAVPQAWVSQIEENVDELWVPSQFVRNVFLRAGVASERIRVIPNGIDTALFSPEGTILRPAGSRKFVFLFVGGAIRRKGIDLLLAAYKATFDAHEDVSLVLALPGRGGAYQHNSLTTLIQRAAGDSRCPHVQIITDAMDDATLASLYRGCDAFVLPYRGEGFGMPLLEAMACGKTTIATAMGPSQDFASQRTACLVSAREESVPDELPPLGKLSGPFTWFEPDFSELTRTLRHVYEHPQEAAQRGRLAGKHVRQHFAWPRITRLYLDRIYSLMER